MECHYEEKNENVPAKLEVELVETALRETTLRETRIDDVVPKRAEYIHTLEAQSSVDSDVVAHNVMYTVLYRYKFIRSWCRCNEYVMRGAGVESRL